MADNKPASPTPPRSSGAGPGGTGPPSNGGPGLEAPDRSGSLLDYQRMSEVVIEIADPKNRSYFWPYPKQVLRGRWCRANMPGTTMAQALAAMPDLPGMAISCDPSARTIKIFDLLADAPFEETLAKARRVHQNAYGTIPDPCREVLHEDQSDEQLKTTLWLMRQAVDAGCARLLHGNLPSAREFERLPGKTRMELFSNSRKAQRYREEPVPGPT